MSNLANLKTKLEQFHHLLKIIRKIMDRKNCTISNIKSNLIKKNLMTYINANEEF
jgi:hypothetical protein